MRSFVFKMSNCVLKNEELCIESDEFCRLKVSWVRPSWDVMQVTVS